MSPRPRVQEVLSAPTHAAVFLVLTVRHGAQDEVREQLAEVPSITRAVGFKRAEDQLTCVVGIGAQLWDRMYDAPRPVGLHQLAPVVGATHTAVSTPGDLLLHIRAQKPDLCFELARRLTNELDGSVDVVDEVHAFRYFDRRDLLGFVDGTENPTGDDAVAAIEVGDEDPDYAGSSYVLVQKYVHDLQGWEALTVDEQEQAIGRHKTSDIEIPDEEKATNSHVALNTLTDEDGNDREIVRDNLPFGDIASQTFGTYYIGYASEPDVLEDMLENMFIGDPPGNHDRILDFSTALTGCLFFIPTQDFLDEPPAESESADVDGEPAPESADSNGSLKIGSLKRS